MSNSLVIFLYNEKLNMLNIINKVLSQGFEVLVVDDNLTDRT